MFLSGVLTTAGRLALVGDLDRYVKAFNVDTGACCGRPVLGGFRTVSRVIERAHHCSDGGTRFGGPVDQRVDARVCGAHPVLVGVTRGLISRHVVLVLSYPVPICAQAGRSHGAA